MVGRNYSLISSLTRLNIGTYQLEAFVDTRHLSIVHMLLSHVQVALGDTVL